MDEKPQGEPASGTGTSGTSGAGTAGAAPKTEQELDEDDLEFDSLFSTRRPKDFKAGVSSGMKSIGMFADATSHVPLRCLRACTVHSLITRAALGGLPCPWLPL